MKFVPVSGRPAGYVLRVLHECRDMLDGAGLPYVCDYGAAEQASCRGTKSFTPLQGAVIVDASRSYGPKYMGYSEHMNLKSQIAAILRKNEYQLRASRICLMHLLSPTAKSFPTNRTSCTPALYTLKTRQRRK